MKKYWINVEKTKSLIYNTKTSRNNKESRRKIERKEKFIHGECFNVNVFSNLNKNIRLGI